MHRRWHFLFVACLLWVALLQPLQVSATPVAVINGTDVAEMEYPWVVALVQAAVSDDYLSQFCGGTLIAARWVLTSAHCTFDKQEKPFQPADLAILVGRRVLRTHVGARLPVDQIIRHPQFNNVTYSHDIALLHLATAATIAPVQLGDLSQHTATSHSLQVHLVGWGIMRDGVGANVLQQGQTLLVPAKTCRDFYAAYHVQLDDEVICTSYREGSADACIGDSGGPLLLWDSSQRQWAQIGIISWGVTCAETEFYGVYTDVASFRNWIERVAGSR